MKKITSSVYTFEDIIKDEFLYIDKTEFIWSLISQGKAMYFLSRPRRFGKSLTVSTLKAVFQGKKELFKGLAIYDKPYDWKPYPVIHLDMNGLDFSSVEELESSLCDLVTEAAASHELTLESANAASMFRVLINRLAEQEQVVILVDEYDKPILNNLGKPHAQKILDKLKVFYSVIKAFESKERFVFVTGVSKFCHVSLFSDLNNLTDITMNRDYATMFGYTQEEFETYFADRIDAACKLQNMPRGKLLPEIKQWYDGFRFEEESETVYNPVSLAQFFTNSCKFNNYWFSTGTPSFLVELTKKTDFNFEKTLSEPVMGLAFNAFEIDKIDPLALLLQTGYLTIKSSFVDLGETLYYLDFPNREVKSAFETYLISDYASIPQETVGANVFKMVKAIKARDINLFMELLKTFFAAVQYDIATDTEGRFQLLFYSVFLLIGVRVEAESRTNNGRIDAVIRDGNHVYIFEFKINKTAEIALDQIREKEYFRKYQHSGRKIVLVGANFDTGSRQITKWKSETVC
ncbi:ATP-binding protein [uncultured Victivallis sp.]|uniref:ATP-binding protein n=1 Tax=uncultured Victivallis sp. TaxID=354118 RepID=UPI0025EA0F5C|nr:ATP-binding protein [uncultured Victivallis sp.]